VGHLERVRLQEQVVRLQQVEHLEQVQHQGLAVQQGHQELVEHLSQYQVLKTQWLSLQVLQLSGIVRYLIMELMLVLVHHQLNQEQNY
jgi:hypothetical protein